MAVVVGGVVGVVVVEVVVERVVGVVLWEVVGGVVERVVGEVIVEVEGVISSIANLFLCPCRLKIISCIREIEGCFDASVLGDHNL